MAAATARRPTPFRDDPTLPEDLKLKFAAQQKMVEEIEAHIRLEGIKGVTVKKHLVRSGIPVALVCENPKSKAVLAILTKFGLPVDAVVPKNRPELPTTSDILWL